MGSQPSRGRFLEDMRVSAVELATRIALVATENENAAGGQKTARGANAIA
jgi:hypothetical protein